MNQRGLLRVTAAFIAAFALIATLFGAGLGGVHVAHAATITVNGSCSLVNAIASANTDSSVGGCTAGSGADTVLLTVNVILPVPNNGTDGGNALPVITSPITIDGQNTYSISGFGLTARLFDVAASGSLTLQNVTDIAGGSDHSGLGGGAIYVHNGTLTVGNATISGNSTFTAGGAIYYDNNGATLNVSNTTFEGNSATNIGGAIDDISGMMTLTGDTFNSNTAVNGGALTTAGTVTITNNIFSFNTSAGNGAAIANGASLMTISGSLFNQNVASSGGAIYNFSGTNTLNISSSTFSTNTASNGAGVVVQNGNMTTINTSTFYQNTSSSSGGGVYVGGGTVHLNNDAFNQNSALATGTSGGGIYNGGVTTISSSTFASNSGKGVGGGIFNVDTLTVSNSTFSQNTANLAGGGLYNDINVATVANSTFSQNSANGSGGAILNNGTLNLGSTILAGNTAASIPDLDNAGTTTSLGHNLVQTVPAGVVFLGSDQTGVGAQLSALADNGGPTQTMVLHAGSPAIGQGNCSTLSGVSLVTTDQRGINRKAVCDVGAFETAPTITFLQPTLPNGIVNVPYSQKFSVTSTDPNATPFTFAITGGALPAGLSLSSGGTISGTPTAEGIYLFTVTVTDAHGYTDIQDYALAIAPVMLLTPGTLPNAVLNQPYSQTITASGGVGPYTYSVLAGSLPTGLTLNSSTGVLSGTPTQAGTFTFNVTVIDFNSFATTIVYGLTVTGPKDTIGVYRTSATTFYLRRVNGTGYADYTIPFGNSNSAPLTGDWNGDGVDSVGVVDTTNGLFTLTDATLPPYTVNYTFVLGNPGDEPLVGRWNNATAHDGVGVFRPSNGLIYLRNTLTTGFADYTMVLGIPGDWDGNGFDSPGVYRSNNTFYLSNQVCNCAVFADYTFSFGSNDPGAKAVSGDWTGIGHTGIGLLFNGVVTLKYYPYSGNQPDLTFAYGVAGDVPVGGYWGAGNGGVAHPVAGNSPPVLVPNTPIPVPTSAPNHGPGLGD